MIKLKQYKSVPSFKHTKLSTQAKYKKHNCSVNYNAKNLKHYTETIVLLHNLYKHTNLFTLDPTNMYHKEICL